MQKAQLHLEDQEALLAEARLMQELEHPNIVGLHALFDEHNEFYLVMDLIQGGELFDRIVGMGKYSEEDARYFTFKLLNAVLYLHDRQICHRDLKPENILLASQEENAELKISDFGLSKVAASDELLMSTRCGTPGYVAPEVLTQERGSGGRRYGTACDMWSVGCVILELLDGGRLFNVSGLAASVPQHLAMMQRLTGQQAEHLKSALCRVLSMVNARAH